MKHCPKIFLLPLLLALFTSCSLGLAPNITSGEVLSTPTSHAFFTVEDITRPATVGNSEMEDILAIPTVSHYFTQREMPTPHATVSSQTTFQHATPLFNQTTMITTTIFGDGLNPNWKFIRSQGMDFERIRDASNVHSGNEALMISPVQDFSSLYLVVDSESQETYRHDEVLGISFWLSGGDDLIATDELAVTVLGSNAYPYWEADDNSVDLAGDSFSESRLYDLDINRSIPPQTWVEVVVWLDNLIYDPDYEYVTGFYVKNGEGYLNTFYIDDVNLLMLAGEVSELQATPVP